jgi:DNA-binding CsgD family transcriptional regulator
MLRYARTDQPWYLEGRTPEGRRWTVPIAKNPFVIGRSDACDLMLLDPAVSRAHAEIAYSGDAVTIRDLRSTNGTFVNQGRVKGPARLCSGDGVTFGRLSFRVVCAGDRGREGVASTAFESAPPRKEGFSDFYGLSRREGEVLGLLLQGKSSKAIAQALCVAFGTAKNHTSNILGKCGAHSRYELIALYNNFATHKGE